MKTAKGVYFWDTAGKRYLDWELEDPAGKPLATVRRIRDEIDGRVQALLVELVGGRAEG